MKLQTHILLASLALLAAAPSHGDSAALIAQARGLADTDPQGAIALYREAEALPGAGTKDQIQARSAIALLQRDALDDTEAALATLDVIIAMKDASVADRLSARNRKAQFMMRLRTRPLALEMRSIWADIGRDAELSLQQRLTGWLAAARNATDSSVFADLDEARAHLDGARTLEGLNDNQRAEILRQAVATELKAGDYRAANAFAQQLLGLPEASSTHKAAAHYELAGIHLIQGEEEAADREVRKGLALPDLAPAQRAAVQADVGKLNARMFRHAAAREAYAEAARLDPRQAVRYETAMAATWIADRQYDEAVRMHLDGGRHAEAAAVRQTEGDFVAATNICLAAIGDPELPEPERWNAMARFFNICDSANFFEAAREMLGQAREMIENTPSRHTALMPLLATTMRRAAYPCAADIAGLLCKTPSLSAQNHWLARLYRVNALAGLGDLPGVARSADEFAQDTRLAPWQRLFFSYVQTLLSGTEKPKEIRALLAAVETAYGGDDISPSQKQDALLRAGRTAMIVHRFATAKAVAAYYDGLFVPEPVKTYTVSFMSDAPRSIDSFIAAGFLQDSKRRGVFDRKFGGNLELVAATDAATGDRGDISLAAVTTGGDTETYFYAVCDADGIHIFFDARDDQAAEVAAGLLRGGSFEGYIAAGENDPHTCFLVNLQTGIVSFWNAAYANEFHRPIKADRSGFRHEFRHTADSHLLYFFFGWENFFDKVPGDSDQWLFETARWARGGRVTWNGLKTVHGRSSFGRWRFAMTDADRLAIKRRLVTLAWSRYRDEKNPRTGGMIDFYGDADYSDPAFQAAAVAPLIEKLDAYGARVSATMTDTEVATLFAEAVPHWMNIRYRLGDLRRSYLEQKLAGPPAP